MNGRIVAIAFALTGIAGGMSLDSTDLGWHPKAGETFEEDVRFEFELEIEGMKFSCMSRHQATTKVLSTDDETIIIETTPKLLKQYINGIETEMMPPEQKEIALKPRIAKYKPDGTLISGDEVQISNGKREGQFVSLRRPGKHIKVGDSWSREFKADPNGGLPFDAIGTFTLKGEEKLDNYDTWLVEGDYHEKGDKTSYKGTFTHNYDKVTGKLLKSRGILQNVVVTPEAKPTTIHGFYDIRK